MIGTVTIYFNTGFNGANYPTKKNALGTSKKTYPSIYVLQDQIIATCRIETTFEKINGADYLEFTTEQNTTYYIILDFVMINENVAELTLQVDPFLTVGIENIIVNNGWACRKHVSKDEPFANVLPEPFTPSKASVIEVKELEVPEEVTNIVASSIDLTDVTPEPVEGFPEKPLVKGVETNTIVYFPSRQNAMRFKKKTLGYCLYEYEDIPKGTFEKLNALGMANCILASYTVPSRFIHRKEKQGILMTELVGDGIGYPNIDLPYKYNPNIKNAKAYCTNSIYHLFSIVSGNKVSYPAHDIYEKGSDKPAWIVHPDVSPNGKPYARPDVYRGYKGDHQGGLISSVQGASWLNNPIIYTGGDGWGINGAITSLSVQMGNNNALAIKDTIAANNAVAGASQAVNRANLNASLNTFDINKANLTSQYRSDMSVAKFNLLKNQSSISGTVYEVAKRGINAMGGNGTFPELNAIDVGYANSMNSLNTARQNAINTANAQAGLLSAQAQSSNAGLSQAIQNAYLSNRRDILQYVGRDLIVSPSIIFPVANGLEPYVGNNFLVCHERLSDDDVLMYDEFLTKYGYAVSEKLVKSDFTSRRSFNYIQVNDVSLKATKNINVNLIKLMESLLMVGVRLWHKKIDNTSYVNNDIVS